SAVKHGLPSINSTRKSSNLKSNIASEGQIHRVFEISLADLQNGKDHSYRMIHLRAEDVQGKNVLTNFWGMDFTTDKLRCSALASQRRGPTRSRGPAMLNLAKSCVSLADLQNDKDHSYRMIHLRAEDVQGKNVLSSIL
ncbi:40S ribosomal protein S3a-like protein, partial [Tanacetum coccineum]